MNKPSPENPDRRRHRREKATIDHLVDHVFDPKSPEKHQQPAMTDSGASIEEQCVRNGIPRRTAVCQCSDQVVTNRACPMNDRIGFAAID
jgi:hypothetical protein